MVNGVVKATYYDTILAYTTARTIQSFSTQSPCKIQITYTGYISSIYLYAPGTDVTSTNFYASDITTNNPKTLISTLNAAGTWYVAIAHGITSGSQNLSSFSLDMKTFS